MYSILTTSGIDYQLVNGRPSARIRHLKKGIAVGDPEKTLSGLGGELPEIRPGSVVAGNLGEFPVLKRIRREVAG
jgi:hypothetical protein